MRTPADEAETRSAKDLAERGEHFLRQPLSKRTLEQALARFDAALRESPRYVPALVGLGRAWFNLASGWYREPGPAAEHAAEALRRALAIDPANAIAHALLGAVLHQYDYDWNGARASLSARSLAADAVRAFGVRMPPDGARRVRRGRPRASRSRGLDPQYVNARMHMVNLRIAQERLDDAEAELAGVRDIAPSAPAAGPRPSSRWCAARTAMAHYQHACELAPDYPIATRRSRRRNGRPRPRRRRDDRAHARALRRALRVALHLAIVATRSGR